MKRIAFGLAALLVTTGMGFAAAPAMTAKTPSGNVYTDMKGMTLYTFDKDEAGKSNCDKKCQAEWPTFKASATSKAEGDWSVVKNNDGTYMWAYEGKPLYTYVDDKKAGDMTGDGHSDMWHVVKAK
jgi:predicted lipoprotein with Yx(FWY)xxD motif